MKKILVIILATSFLLACNSGNDDKESKDSASTGLVLNNGAKWKADSSTLFNVALLQNIISGNKKESLEDYNKIATQLQSGLNKMVAECKMKDADHDALHQWLEPLMEMVKELNKATSTENAAANLSEIDKHLKLFAEYFEEQSS